MPELPEVQTTVEGLKKTVVGLIIKDVWTDQAKQKVSRPDHKESIKHLPFWKTFVKSVTGAKIISAERRAKNILINLSNGKTILIHMKMTGHMMYGKYTYNTKHNEWLPSKEETNQALRDPFNKFLRVVWSFANGKQLVLSDVRRFAKVTVLDTAEAHSTKHLHGIGPEPLDKAFTYDVFKERISKKSKGKIKTVLMDQSVIAGIGNIYSDEALWLAGIHPESITRAIPEKKLALVYPAVLAVLKKGIDFGGDSTSDYRRIDGTRGEFSAEHNAYRLTGKPCKKRGCRGVILRKVVNGRSAHFCSVHQELFS